MWIVVLYLLCIFSASSAHSVYCRFLQSTRKSSFSHCMVSISIFLDWLYMQHIWRIIKSIVRSYMNGGKQAVILRLFIFACRFCLALQGDLAYAHKLHKFLCCFGDRSASVYFCLDFSTIAQSGYFRFFLLECLLICIRRFLKCLDFCLCTRWHFCFWLQMT